MNTSGLQVLQETTTLLANRKECLALDSHIHFLDNDRVKLSGLKIAGLSGVIGNPKKNFRRREDEFIAAIEKLLSSETDILVMHDGPDGREPGFRGIQEVREIVEFTRPRLVVRGHSHWPKPFVELRNGVQVLNVERNSRNPEGCLS